MTDSIPAQIEALLHMTVGELQAKYLDVFGEETRGRHKQYLFKKIAWRIQELAFGGLSERAKRRAAELVDDTRVRIRPPKSLPLEDPGKKIVKLKSGSRDRRLPLPGTVITRGYGDETHRVKVLEHGFEYQDKPYRSLSAVARAITGSHWNGFL
ncbi:MAG: DUF2924 domain-containing protein, partial [Candidatus Alcyoniella australis]|nr:DUF2924 domain-containing protein [Candidatus Alcyoniella australis]